LIRPKIAEDGPIAKFPVNFPVSREFLLVFLFGRGRFCRHFAPVLGAHAGPVAAETKCAGYLGQSDDENLSAGISWFTFLVAVE
jgi:hypothetical protein